MPTTHNPNQNRTPSQNQNQSPSRSQGQNEGRGFAGMDDDKQRKIAQKGGEAVSRDRQHMSDIGRKGGEASGSGNRGGSRQQT